MEKTRVAVVLAAGIGSRLRPLTNDRPKALVDVGGESIIGRAVRLLAEYGVQKVILATGYREDALERALSDSPVPVVYRRNSEYETTQNSVSLALCEDAIAGESFFKLDGDVVFLPDVLERLDSAGASLAAAVDAGRDLDAEAMKVRVGPDRRILEFGKGIPIPAAGGESIGIERVGSATVASLFAALGRARSVGRNDLYYEDVYSELIGAGLEAVAVDVSDLPWVEVDTLEDLERARAFTAARRV